MDVAHPQSAAAISTPKPASPAAAGLPTPSSLPRPSALLDLDSHSDDAGPSGIDADVIMEARSRNSSEGVAESSTATPEEGADFMMELDDDRTPDEHGQVERLDEGRGRMWMARTIDSDDNTAPSSHGYRDGQTAFSSNASVRRDYRARYQSTPEPAQPSPLPPRPSPSTSTPAEPLPSAFKRSFSEVFRSSVGSNAASTSTTPSDRHDGHEDVTMRSILRGESSFDSQRASLRRSRLVRGDDGPSGADSPASTSTSSNRVESHEGPLDRLKRRRESEVAESSTSGTQNDSTAQYPIDPLLTASSRIIPSVATGSPAEDGPAPNSRRSLLSLPSISLLSSSARSAPPSETPERADRDPTSSEPAIPATAESSSTAASTRRRLFGATFRRTSFTTSAPRSPSPPPPPAPLEPLATPAPPPVPSLEPRSPRPYPEPSRSRLLDDPLVAFWHYEMDNTREAREFYSRGAALLEEGGATLRRIESRMENRERRRRGFNEDQRTSDLLRNADQALSSASEAINQASRLLGQVQTPPIPLNPMPTSSASSPVDDSPLPHFPSTSHLLHPSLPRPVIGVRIGEQRWSPASVPPSSRTTTPLPSDNVGADRRLSSSPPPAQESNSPSSPLATSTSRALSYLSNLRARRPRLVRNTTSVPSPENTPDPTLNRNDREDAWLLPREQSPSPAPGWSESREESEAHEWHQVLLARRQLNWPESRQNEDSRSLQTRRHSDGSGERLSSYPPTVGDRMRVILERAATRIPASSVPSPSMVLPPPQPTLSNSFAPSGGASGIWGEITSSDTSSSSGSSQYSNEDTSQLPPSATARPIAGWTPPGRGLRVPLPTSTATRAATSQPDSARYDNARSSARIAAEWSSRTAAQAAAARASPSSSSRPLSSSEQAELQGWLEETPALRAALDEGDPPLRFTRLGYLVAQRTRQRMRELEAMATPPPPLDEDDFGEDMEFEGLRGVEARARRWIRSRMPDLQAAAQLDGMLDTPSEPGLHERAWRSNSRVPPPPSRTATNGFDATRYTPLGTPRSGTNLDSRPPATPPAGTPSTGEQMRAGLQSRYEARQRYESLASARARQRPTLIADQEAAHRARLRELGAERIAALREDRLELEREHLRQLGLERLYALRADRNAMRSLFGELTAEDPPEPQTANAARRARSPSLVARLRWSELIRSGAGRFGISDFGGFYGQDAAALDPRNYLDDNEFDDSYESLLRLSERLGDVKPKKGVPAEKISSLDKFLYKDWPRPTVASEPLRVPSTSAVMIEEEVPLAKKGIDKEERCAICLMDYEDDEECMRGICGHVFHEPCFSLWLNEHNSCPVCRKNHNP